MNEKPTVRTVVQFNSGRLKGLLAQIISEDGKCLTRDMDGSQYAFHPGPEDTFTLTGGYAALGPKTDAAPVSPALPPALNPADLLEPLPPTVKAVPMNEEPKKAPSRIKPVKPKPAPYTGVKLPYVFNVINSLGDAAEVNIHVRADKQPDSYKGTAVIMASKIIPPSKPYQVSWRLKE